MAAALAGACAAFLVFNFHPARVFMGDSGSMLLGFVIAGVAISGVMKTTAAIAVVAPLLILAIPILDTSFVILKRLKHGLPVYSADRSHFHHRFFTIGWGQRKTVLALYALVRPDGRRGRRAALRPLPTTPTARGPARRDRAGGGGLVALIASVYLIYVLEILKWRSTPVVKLVRESRLARARAREMAERPEPRLARAPSAEGGTITRSGRARGAPAGMRASSMAQVAGAATTRCTSAGGAPDGAEPGEVSDRRAQGAAEGRAGHHEPHRHRPRGGGGELDAARAVAVDRGGHRDARPRGLHDARARRSRSGSGPMPRPAARPSGSAPSWSVTWAGSPAGSGGVPRRPAGSRRPTSSRATADTTARAAAARERRRRRCSRPRALGAG